MGLACNIPDTQLYMRITSTNSISLKHITVEGCVINSNHRGEILILLKHNTSHTIKIKEIQNVAQLIFEKIDVPQLIITPTPVPEPDHSSYNNRTNHIKAYKVSSTDHILFDEKPMKVQCISRPLQPTTPPPSKDTATISVSGLDNTKGTLLS